MILVDSHCHLTDARFEGDRRGVLERAREAGVVAVVTVATDVSDSGAAVRLAEGSDGVWAAVGIHPHEAGRAREEDGERLRELVRHPRVVAVGETGLDYHYERSPRDAQRAWLRRQAEWAAELDLPLVVHSREADGDLVPLLREFAPGVRGVLHSFTGGPELLETALEAGWYVSFSGIVTFRNFRDHGLLRSVPRDRILVETDAPHLTPEPRRGRRNEPALVRHVVEGVARIRGEDPEDTAEATVRNAGRLFRIAPEGGAGEGVAPARDVSREVGGG